jgi:hypothetical protein
MNEESSNVHILDRFFSMLRIQQFIEKDIHAELKGSQSERLIQLYGGEFSTYSKQTVTNSHFASKKDSFPWISDLGDHVACEAREYLWQNNTSRPLHNARFYLESGIIRLGSLQGEYGGIHIETEAIPKKGRETPSIGNTSVKIILLDYENTPLHAYRRDHDKRWVGGRRGDFTKQIPTEHVLNPQYKGIPIHLQEKN